MIREETIEKIEALEDILRQFKALLRETVSTLEGTPDAYSAEGIWIANIKCALDNDHQYSPNPNSMQGTIDDLREFVDTEGVIEPEDMDSYIDDY